MEFGFYVRQNPIGVLVPGAGAVFSQYDAVIPDLVFVLNERWEDVASGPRLTGAPDIVIEIISPGADNRSRDLFVKRQLYAKYGVAEYWVVDPESQTVEIYRLLGTTLEKIANLKDDDRITSPMLSGFELKISALFVP